MPMIDPVVHVMGYALPRIEVFSLVVVGLVLVAGLMAIGVVLAEERRKARREAQDKRPPSSENPHAGLSTAALSRGCGLSNRKASV